MLDQAPEHRAAYLDERCGSDAGLRTSVEQMLRADRGSGGVIDDESWRARRLAERLRQDSEDDPLAAPGVVIGGYRLIERIGSGGMGAVWRAHRADNVFERTVAIKLIKRGLDTDEVLRRFRLERQVLARLEHPHIARLYDGGATEDGRPYLVMEHVDGVPIDQYCREQSPSIESVLALFGDVCDAVHFAHSNLVLHRDIKPANVLVTPDSTVKLLDFGIAKLLNDQGDSATVTLDQRMLTPRYASPEQIRGARLTTSSDIYGLGVLLYELVTGHSPYRHLNIREELERAVLHEPLPAPSVPAVHHLRGPWSRRFRADLDLVVGRALAKSPTDRYASVEQLGEDVRRLREGLPLLFRGLSPLGNLARLARRHSGRVVTAVVLAVALMAVGAVTVGYWFLAPQWAQERVRAARRSLLTPELANTIWVLTFNNTGDLFSRHRPPDCPQGTAAIAVAAYDEALRYDASLFGVRVERDTVWLAGAISRATDPSQISGFLAGAAPLTSAYASTWARDGVIPEVTDSQLEAASPTDLRSLGLLAILCGNPRDGIRAWSRVGDYAPDPLVESLLGVLYLAIDEPERAYPRLLSAYRQHPDLGFLCTYLADAAVAVGDTTVAANLIERAAGLDQLDPLEALRRVRLRYLLATGQDQAADLLLAESAEHDNPVLRVQYAQYLFQVGQSRRALAVLGEFCGGNPGSRTVPAPIMTTLLELTQRWWTDADDDARRAVIAGALDESPDELESLYRILDNYDRCLERIARFHTEQANPLTPVPLATDSLLASNAHSQIVAIRDRLGLQYANRWVQFRNYPPELRARQIEAWESADPESQSAAVEQAYREWRRAARPNAQTGYLKLLPTTANDLSFGRVVGVEKQIAIVLSTRSLATYDLDRPNGGRAEVPIPPGMRARDVCLDGNRVAALLGADPTDSEQRAYVQLFGRDRSSGDWKEAGAVELPPIGESLETVGLSGRNMCVITRGDRDRHAHLLGGNDGGQVWTLEHTAWAGPVDSDAHPPQTSFGAGTLALLSGWRDVEDRDQRTNTLSVIRRRLGGKWQVELELRPPGHLGSGAVWNAVACDRGGDVVVATAAPYVGSPTAALVYRRDMTGEWRQEAELCGHVRGGNRRWLGIPVALDGDRIALAESDAHKNVRLFHWFERSESRWRHVGTIGPFDSAYSDDLGPPALSTKYLLIGAPRHDAGGIDTGAVYVVDLSAAQPDRASTR
ncbi:MAG: serine/threonine-protein kinase [Phycisphaerae bacterium]